MTLGFPENKKTASRYVKKAIPMMVQNNIVPNPCNFALWYSYVSNRDAELKVALDNEISTTGTCAPEVSEKLFRKHVFRDEVQLQESVQESLSNLLLELTQDVDSTRAGTDDLNNSLQQNLATLTQSSEPETIKLVVKNLIASTEKTSTVFDRFHEQLSSAELEIAALKSQLEQRERDAYTDPLTKLGNRRAFDRKLYELCESETKRATLVLVDLDHFKSLNDTYGHLIGDKVLQGVAQIMQQLCPDNTLAARYGGEEFAYLLEDGSAAAAKLAERTREMMHRLSLRKQATNELIDNITASFGVAEQQDDELPEELIARADKALYLAKESGRDQVQQAA
ncbi:MAG: GGDEF domain-containing protein [Pseudomonadales bacterium]